jgi:hypothetical protein
MFVRFRSSVGRLDISLVEAVRPDGKPRQEHVASLGSIPQPVSVADRATFWSKLHERLAKLSNRLDSEARARVLGAVNERIPMATVQDQRQAQLTNARAEAEVYRAVADWLKSGAEDSKKLLAAAERKIAANENGSCAAAEIAQAAKDRIDRLEQGESVAGGFGRPANLKDVMLELGFNRTDLRRMSQISALTEEQFKAVVAEKLRRSQAASDWMPRDERSLVRTVSAHRAKRRKA